MASPNIGQILRASGRLSINPTAVNLLSGSWPWGGIGLGLVQDVAVKPMRAHEVLREESFGTEVVDVLDLGEAWMLTAAVRTFDPDSVTKLFAAPSTGAVSGQAGIAYPGTFRAGTLRSTAAVKLLFTPDDQNVYPCVYFPNALPIVDEAAELKLVLNAETLIMATFYATRDGTGRAAIVSRLEDLVP